MSDGSTPHLRTSVAGAVATLTFARPEKSNAYDKAMLRALDGGLRRAADDAAVRVLVLRGEGRHFCAGADLGPQAPDEEAKDTPGIADVCLRLSQLPKPTVALVQGACIGGGMAFACCCDIVIASRDAFFSLPEVRIGFAPAPLIPFVLSALGERHARRLLMSGARISAEEALRTGLVTELAATNELEPALTATLANLLQSAPGAVATVKAEVARLRTEPPTADLLATLQSRFDAARDGAEADEGRAARREKRPPRWAIEP
jgi:methylglutaconyl-CoA hydratase